MASAVLSAALGHAEKRKAHAAEFPPKGTSVRHTRLDCSHYVHEIFQRAHRPYPYASSEELYYGVGSFTRVLSPMPGDLIVWRGHVGIVTDPNENRFVSVQRSGVKNDDYLSRYWRSRGKPRFLRYVGQHGTENSTRASSQGPYSSAE